MSDRALSVGGERGDVAARRAELEQDALMLAGSIQWDKAAQLVGRNAGMPAFLATYVSDREGRYSPVRLPPALRSLSYLFSYFFLVSRQ